MRLYDQPPPGGSPVKLQGPAMRAFKAAEVRYGKRTGRMWRAIPLTGSWRSCSLQTQLYRSNTTRYANPDGSLHCRGLAIDVSTASPNQAIIVACLKAEGWHRFSPDREPWHHSFFRTG